MNDVSAIKPSGLRDKATGLAGVTRTTENADRMAEHTQTKPSDLPSKEEQGPSLRLAGTPAGEPGEQEQKILHLRKEMVLVMSAIEQDAGMISDRLARSGRIDPMQQVTGSSALDSATRQAEQLIREIDSLFMEVADEVTSRS